MFYHCILSFLTCGWLLIRYYWTPGNSGEDTVRMMTGRHAQKLVLGRRWVHLDSALHYIFYIISHLWLTSHPRSTLVLLDTCTPGTSREDTVRMLMERLELLGHSPSQRSICDFGLVSGSRFMTFSGTGSISPAASRHARYLGHITSAEESGVPPGVVLSLWQSTISP